MFLLLVATAAFSAGSAPGSSGSAGKGYIPHCKCSSFFNVGRNNIKQHSPLGSGQSAGANAAA
eukprot:5864430-Prymnesium_polylepis.1